MPLPHRSLPRHFDTERQRVQIQTHGTQVVVFRCMPCPCILEEGHYDPNCTSHEGNGRFYPPEMQFATVVLPQREDSQLEYLQAGLLLSGTIQVTILPEDDFAEHDKVRFVDKKIAFREVLQKDVRDALRFSSGVEIAFIVDRTRIYRAGHDYVLTPPNTITWQAGGEAPEFSQNYSVRYQAHADYLVQGDDPRMRIEGRRVQSSEVVLRRLDHIDT